MIPTLKHWARVTLGLLYPVNCAVCGNAVETSESNSWLCGGCRPQLRPLPKPFCERCSLPYAAAVSGPFICAHCGDREFHFKRAVCGCRLGGVARECIHAFKYKRALWLGPELADLMIAAARKQIQWSDALVVVPVPLFTARLREREFNQSEWLARKLVRALPARLELHNLLRIRDTPQQALLNPKERVENVRGAFSVRRPDRLAGREAILVDDVFTTGATTSECARVLRAAGVRSTIVLTVARG